MSGGQDDGADVELDGFLAHRVVDRRRAAHLDAFQALGADRAVQAALGLAPGSRLVEAQLDLGKAAAAPLNRQHWHLGAREEGHLLAGLLLDDPVVRDAEAAAFTQIVALQVAVDRLGSAIARGDRIDDCRRRAAHGITASEYAGMRGLAGC